MNEAPLLRLASGIRSIGHLLKDSPDLTPHSTKWFRVLETSNRGPLGEFREKCDAVLHCIESLGLCPPIPDDDSSIPLYKAYKFLSALRRGANPEAYLENSGLKFDLQSMTQILEQAAEFLELLRFLHLDHIRKNEHVLAYMAARDRVANGAPSFASGANYARHLRPSERSAYAAYLRAYQALSTGHTGKITDKQAFQWLRENPDEWRVDGLQDYELPHDHKTFARQLRSARRVWGAPKQLKRLPPSETPRSAIRPKARDWGRGSD